MACDAEKTENLIKYVELGTDIPVELDTDDSFALTMERVKEIKNIPANCKKLAITCCLIDSMQGLQGLDLEHLDLYKNKITKIDYLEKMTNLRFLDLAFNKIEKIENLTNNRQVTELFLEANAISDIEGLDMLVQLTNLELGSNKITKVKNLQHLTELEQLYLGRNLIRNSKLHGTFNKLRILSLQCNRLTRINPDLFDECPNLQELYLSQNALKEAPEHINKLKKLKILDLSISLVSTLDHLSDCNSLEQLWVSETKIESIDALKPLSHLPNLRVVSYC